MIVQKKIVVLLICFLISSICFISVFTSTSASKIQKIPQMNDGNQKITQFPNGILNTEKWDWRDVDGNDWTTPIRDQIQDACGSCWAFGALGGLEANYKRWMNDPDLSVDLSEQYILSCSPGSCNGWYLQRTLSWIQNNGIISEDCMPYRADDTIPCEAKCEEWYEGLFGIKDYHKIPRGNITAIKEALLTYGPLPATMTVYGDFYPEWEGGVYRYEYGEFVFGHVVTIVGFDDTWGNDDEGYWICKNSWGTKWGENGWFRIAYGECEIEKNVYYYENINYPPNTPEKPQGPVQGKPNIFYTYSSTCEDPDGNDLYYLFDWGDGNQTNWLGPYATGETVEVNYSWKTKGDYLVKVKTMDSFGPYISDRGIESQWSDSLDIAMPKGIRNKQSNSIYQILNQLFERYIPLFNMFFQ